MKDNNNNNCNTTKTWYFNDKHLFAIALTTNCDEPASSQYKHTKTLIICWHTHTLTHTFINSKSQIKLEHMLIVCLYA